MDTIDTISDLLALSNCQYRIYDIGRKIDKLSKEQFQKIEANQMPYPFPSQGHAFFAIAFWQKQSPTPYLWFVKLPLDERGLINQGARNHFIAIIVEALGSDLSVNPNEKQEELLKANPYNFTPAQYKLAALNSLLKVELKQPASIYFEHCQQYFLGQLGWQAWQEVGVQGIADFTARLTEENQQALVSALPHLPNEVLNPLCCGLENQTLSASLIEALINHYKTQQATGNSAILASLLRALASSITHPYCIEFIEELLAEPLSDELLITLAGRCWLALTDEKRLLTYLESLVSALENNNPAEQLQLFSAIFKDLVAIPTIRPILFQCMRAPQRSNNLAKAIGALFNQVNPN